jgi:hypothetical protein
MDLLGYQLISMDDLLIFMDINDYLWIINGSSIDYPWVSMEIHR